MFRTVLSFDMRAPDFGAPAGKLYDAALDMCAFGDEIGIDGVIFPEHHCSEDGYNPVPALMGTAAAARTKRMGIVIGAIVLPLHDPVEVAETIAAADNICGGRLWTTLAAGYVEAEFAMFGKSLKDRAKLMDEGLDVIVRALKGERFEWQGR
jgi:alkanesulfonate monooxygenase SsuD/methylene tetrahydromethanopterin reductase-like flavin-dependent oxidoreductase (luciferase family)